MSRKTTLYEEKNSPSLTHHQTIFIKIIYSDVWRFGDMKRNVYLCSKLFKKKNSNYADAEKSRGDGSLVGYRP